MLQYETECVAAPHTHCVGPRAFRMKRPCDWVRGHTHARASVLSVALGGLGIDRFYMGETVLGALKALSFGGAGVWTAIDAVATVAGIRHPSDGSRFADVGSLSDAPRAPGPRFVAAFD